MFRSSVFFWDHGTESFWLQASGECLVGPQTGKKLKWIPTTMTTWAQWKRAHPKTTVLGPVLPMKEYRETTRGYASYERRGRPLFPTGPNKKSIAFRPMDRITIVHYDGKVRAYPHKSLRSGANPDGKWSVGRAGQTVTVRDAQGNLVPSMSAYWFALAAFYPDATVWKPTPLKSPK